MKIAVLERNSVGVDIDVSCFEDFGEVFYYPNTVREDTAAKVKDVEIIIANKAPMNEQTLKEAKNVRLICEFATGFDNIDLEYCNKRGIKVANVRNYSTAAVAQHTFTLALSLIEKLSFYNDYVKSGIYGSQDRFSNFDEAFIELEGKTWGIIGMGNIGRKVAKIAEAFGCKVIFYSASGKNNSTEYEKVDLDMLCRKSDVISIHCPLTERTRNLINLTTLSKMKRRAVLINVARGAIVNSRDLYTALTENFIGAAGLDVLEEEPISPDNPLGTIADSTKLIITPHMAWASTEARTRLVSEVYKNIEAFLNGEERNIIN